MEYHFVFMTKDRSQVLKGDVGLEVQRADTSGL